MLLLGVLLACGLVTLLAVAMCELQLREAQHSVRVMVLPVDERQRFDSIVAPLLADPELGRVER